MMDDMDMRDDRLEARCEDETLHSVRVDPIYREYSVTFHVWRERAEHEVRITAVSIEDAIIRARRLRVDFNHGNADVSRCCTVNRGLSRDVERFLIGD
jgi:hypothetical protein